MIACICRGITDAQVEEACDYITSPEQLHEYCGTRMKCGQCLFYIETKMEKHHSGNLQQDQERPNGSSEG